ncbi:hypothetical protein Btru_002276 [Bulinus truncatus]|nr:hypothetical protein Btru_002276 [Bulinus truncatus]
MLERPRVKGEDRRPSVDSYEDYEDRVAPHQVNLHSRKEDREREKTLQKKLTDLTSQIQRLERRISLLRSENDVLKKKQEDQKPLEDKIKSLKKRNAELASIARRLEEKAKLLQQENTKIRPKTFISAGTEEINPEAENLKRLFARQRAKDLAEHARSMLAKDKEIEELRRKCQELADQLSNGDLLIPLNAAQFEEKDELVNIIKQAAKERLLLEQQLSNNRNSVKSPNVEESERQSSNDKYTQELKAANQILHNEIEKLESALRQTERLERQLTEKSLQCQSLSKELDSSRLQNQQLQADLVTVTSEKQKLDQEVWELRQRLHGLDKVHSLIDRCRLSLIDRCRLSLIDRCRLMFYYTFLGALAHRPVSPDVLLHSLRYSRS